MIEFLAAALLIISFAEINGANNIAKQLDAVSSQVRTVSEKVDAAQHEVAEVSTKVDTMQQEIVEISGKIDTAIHETTKLRTNTSPMEIKVVLPHIERVLSAIKEMLSDINIKMTHTFIYKSSSSPKTLDTPPGTADPNENYGYMGICDLIGLDCSTTLTPIVPKSLYVNKLAQGINTDYPKVYANIHNLEHWIVNNRQQLKSEIKHCEKSKRTRLGCYYLSLVKKVNAKNLKEDIVASMDFFEKLSICHFSTGCDRVNMQKNLLHKAKSIYANFFPYVCSYRDSSHPDVWKNVEKLFREILTPKGQLLCVDTSNQGAKTQKETT